jgi:UDP-N-acetylglucosamine 2-epimerase
MLEILSLAGAKPQFIKAAIISRKKNAETEWIEIIENGNRKLADASPTKIVAAEEDYVQDQPAQFSPIFGNGDAAGTIFKTVLNAVWR